MKNRNMHFLLIGNPENRRIQGFVDAALAQQYRVQVVSYLDILNQKTDINALITPDTCLRIDSWGENFEVWKKMLALGAAHTPLPHISASQALTLPFEKGRIQYQTQWYQGYVNLLHEIKKTLQAHHPNIQYMNSPDAIALMFDKMTCQTYLAQHHIHVPKILGKVQSYEHLQTLITETQQSRLFIKPSHSSSASGVMAYRKTNHKEQLICHIEWMEDAQGIKLYNSLKPQVYQDTISIRKIVDEMAKEAIFAENWLSKASNELGSFDFRILVINGKAKHCVVRQSKMPITNLHLGNQRGNLEKVITQIGWETWEKLKKMAEDAVKSIQGIFYAGVDVLLSANHQQMMILELNAFGDLLPNVLLEGKSTYQEEIFEWSICGGGF
jgi:glutathione synthase/RimK-type ligase-like ATP-grasp enzyme